MMHKKSGMGMVLALLILVMFSIAIVVSMAFWFSGFASLFTRFERIEFFSGYHSGLAPAYAITMNGRNSGSSDISIVELIIQGKPIGDFDRGNFTVKFTETSPNRSVTVTKYAKSGAGWIPYSSGLSVPIVSGSKVTVFVQFSSSAPLTSGQLVEATVLTSSGLRFGKMYALLQPLAGSTVYQGVFEIASGLSSPYMLFAEGGFVYFTSASGLSKVPASGGAVTTLTNDCNSSGIIVNEGYVYFSTGGSAGCPTRILKTPLVGGQASELVRSEQQIGSRLLISGEFIYYIEVNAVKRVSTSGGNIELLVQENSRLLDIATDGSRLYYVVQDGAIKSVSISSLVTTTVTSILPSANSTLVYNSGFLYFSEHESRRIRRVSMDGVEVQSLASAEGVVFLEVVGGTVYFTEPDAGDVKSVPVGGGNVSILASGLGKPSFFQVREDSVYVTDRHKGSILKISLSATSQVIGVGIDIKPGDVPNSVNCRSQPLPDNVPVGIFSDRNFSAANIDVSSLFLEGFRVEEVHSLLHLEDLDGDGDLDGVVHLSKEKVCGATSTLPLRESVPVTLTGKTSNRGQFKGTDTIRILQR